MPTMWTSAHSSVHFYVEHYVYIFVYIFYVWPLDVSLSSFPNSLKAPLVPFVLGGPGLG